MVSEVFLTKIVHAFFISSMAYLCVYSSDVTELGDQVSQMKFFFPYTCGYLQMNAEDS